MLPVELVAQGYRVNQAAGEMPEGENDFSRLVLDIVGELLQYDAIFNQTGSCCASMMMGRAPIL